MRRRLIAGFLLALAGCTNGTNMGDDGGAPTPDAGCPPPAGPDAVSRRLFDGLKPACEGCHVSGVRAFFASFEAFQSLVLADPRLVVPGDPDKSEFYRLLIGQGAGPFKQMPIAGPPYSQLPGALVPIADVRSAIEHLGAQARNRDPDPAAPTVTRLGAYQIQRALYQQLGLAYADFFRDAPEYGIAMAEPITDDLYPLQGHDQIPAARQAPTAERYRGLGGGSIVDQVRPQNGIAPTFVQVLTQVSQRWCRLALAKPGNKALFPNGGALPKAPDEVKTVLGRWHRHFLAEDASAAQIDRLYSNLFVPLAAQANVPADTPWVGACSYFIRHPHWIFY